jgi:type IV pilus assembly protein PilC
VHGLSIREKREFYSGLARLIRSGTALPNALELLSRNTPRRVGKLLRALNDRVKNGESLGDAMLRQGARITPLEASIVGASAQAGRLDKGCDQLARYYDSLDRARREITGRMAYPMVMLVFIVCFIKIQLLFTVGAAAYFKAESVQFIYFTAFFVALWLIWMSVAEASRHNVMVERLVRAIPGLGPIRERFAHARFFATLDAQLDARVNIWDALANAARTSDSAKIINGARAALPMLQSGERLSEALAAARVLPDEYLRAFRVAEQSGELDAELTDLAQRTEELAVTALNRWSEWLPRMIYGGALLYGGYQIIQMYAGYLQQLQSFGNIGQ